MREPKPWWKKFHRCRYLKLNGEHKRLDPDREIAMRMYYAMMSGVRAPDENTLFLETAAEFLDHC